MKPGCLCFALNRGSQNLCRKRKPQFKWYTVEGEKWLHGRNYGIPGKPNRFGDIIVISRALPGNLPSLSCSEVSSRSPGLAPRGQSTSAVEVAASWWGVRGAGLSGALSADSLNITGVAPSAHWRCWEGRLLGEEKVRTP